MADLYRDGAGLDTGTGGNAALKAFGVDQVAMMLNSSGAAGGLKQAGTTGWTALAYPISGDRASSGALIGGAAMWVDGPGHSPGEQVASWKVISFLASATAHEPFSQASGYAPVVTVVDSANGERAFPAANPAYDVLRKQFADTLAVPATAGCLTRRPVGRPRGGGGPHAGRLLRRRARRRRADRGRAGRHPEDHRLPEAGRRVSRRFAAARSDPYRRGVYLRPDPHTCSLVTALTGRLRAQYGLVSAGASPARHARRQPAHRGAGRRGRGGRGCRRPRPARVRGPQRRHHAVDPEVSSATSTTGSTA